MGATCLLMTAEMERQGRKAYVSKLKGAARQVVWVSTGESYAVVIGAEVLIYGTDSGDVRGKYPCPDSPPPVGRA